MIGQVIKQRAKSGDQQSGVVEMRAELARKIAAHVQAAGEQTTAIPGLTLYRRTAPTPCYPATYEPSLNVFVQGRKRITLGGTTYLCDESTFLLSSVDVPVVSQIVAASEEVPLLSLLLRLDMTVVREILNQEEFHALEGSSQPRGIAIGKTTVDLLKPCSRLLDLLDTPGDIPFLRNLIQREIVYRLLRGPQGERLRAIATLGDQSHRTAKAIAWLRANYTKPLRVEELAAVARMGMSTLHHHFRALTAMSPLQLPRASECSSTGSMPRVRRSKSGMRARVSSTVSTNASSANPRCGISKRVGSPGRNPSRLNVFTRCRRNG